MAEGTAGIITAYVRRPYNLNIRRSHEFIVDDIGELLDLVTFTVSPIKGVGKK